MLLLGRPKTGSPPPPPVPTSPSSRGLLLRGVSGSRTSWALPYGQGFASRSFVLPFVQDGPLAITTVVLPFWQGDAASPSVAMPFSIDGQACASVDLPFGMLDPYTGVDAWGGVVGPDVGWVDPTPVRALSYRALAWSQPGVLGHWAMDNPDDGNTEPDALGMSPGTYSGLIAAEDSLVVAEPGSSAAFPFHVGHLSLSDPVGILHPGDTFALSCWFTLWANGLDGTLWSAGDDDLQVGIDATNHLRIRKQGVGDIFVTTPTYATLNRIWHILAYKDGSASAGIFIDGQPVAGTWTDRTLAPSGTAPRIGRLTDGTEGHDGTIDEVTLYGSVSDPAALALALYQRGRGLG